LQLLSIYVCFAVCCLTKPQVDLYSHLYASIYDQANKRGRGYSTESENTVSDAEDSTESQDIAMNAFERVQDVCDRIGAVPAHPDWLDVETLPLEGLSFERIVELAQEAHGCLLKSLLCAMRQCKLRQQHALKVTCTEVEGVEDVELSTSLAADLCWIQEFRYSGPCPAADSSSMDVSEDGELHIDAVLGKLCRVNPAVLRALMDATGDRYEDFQTKQWCRCACLRVQGKVRDLFYNGALGNDALSAPELRATDEWEILLARGLTSASIRISQSDKLAFSSSAYDGVVQAARWMAVMWSVVECLTPVTSLLRFGVNQKGRTIHPLRSQETSVDVYDEKDDGLRERLIAGTIVSEPIKSLVVDTLTVLALFPSSNSMLNSAAMHLVPDIEAFDALRTAQVLRLAVSSLCKIQLIHARSGTVAEFAPVAVERLVSFIEEYSDKDANELPSSLVRHTLLLAALDVADLTKIETIAGPDTDMTRFRSIVNTFKLESRSDEQQSEHLIRGLTSYIWHDHALATKESRAFIIHTLCSLLGNTYNEGRLSTPSSLQHNIFHFFAHTLNSTTDDKLISLVKDDICKIPDEEDSPEIRIELCSLLTLVLVNVDVSRKFMKSELIVKLLLDNIDRWKDATWFQKLPILNLLFVHAVVAKMLDGVGTQLIAMFQRADEARSGHSCGTENFSHLCNFLACLQSSMSTKQEKSTEQENELLQSIPSVCTYTKFSDFHEQHWCT